MYKSDGFDVLYNMIFKLYELNRMVEHDIYKLSVGALQVLVLQLSGFRFNTK